ncbi:hypothetical protein CGLO_11725 [Colletotrichum gloeosporioides Cg-14]|uniref:Oxidoreductase n=1 Tax=Colletotrichum gloeosporioides (strain Cg-14) TaxID=1237896 RepID=T0LL54_COLGC|nr:hypothetical protein CGLO_11725 [Colletotrichum gloeosporioides Cg-14]
MARSKIRVGVVGYGFSARNFHIPFIKAVPDLEVTAVFQRAEAPADRTAASGSPHCVIDLPHAKHFQQADDFFADPDIDFVVVATHTDTHAFFAEKSLLAGKHGKSQLRYAGDGDYQTLKKLKSLNAFGKIMEAELHYDFESPSWLKSMTSTEYTPGDGHAFGLGTHSLDQALQLFGRPKSVTAFFRCQRGVSSDVEDSFTIILQYEGDQTELIVTVKTSVTTPMEKQLKYMVRGSEGSYMKASRHYVPIFIRNVLT